MGRTYLPTREAHGDEAQVVGVGEEFGFDGWGVHYCCCRRLVESVRVHSQPGFVVKGGCYVFKSTHLIYLVAQVRGNNQRVLVALSMQEGSE